MTEPGILRRAGEGREVRFERTYDTTTADLWSAVTEPDRLARWLDRVSGERRVGGRVAVHFDDGDAHFEIVECREPEHLVVHWLHAERASRVSVNISAPPDGRASLRLVHDGLTPSQAPEYGSGWH